MRDARALAVFLLDEYELRTRFAPGLLAVAPIVVVGLALGLKNAPVVTAILGLATLAGAPRIMANTVRQRGRAAQADLYRLWNGQPTLELLKSDTKSGNAKQRIRWRRAVEEVTGAPLPTEAEELADPSAADEAYEVAVDEIRERTRDKSVFVLVFAENCNYGFERNLFGVRWIGRPIAFVSTLALISVALFGRHASWQSPGDVLVCLAVEVLLLLLWFFLPTQARVKHTAERYSEQLLNSATMLERKVS